MNHRRIVIGLTLVLTLALGLTVFLALGLAPAQASQSQGRSLALAEEVASLAPADLSDYFYGQWQNARPPSAFSFTRFDAEYSLDTQKIYVLGGRLADSSTSGDIWEFDPFTGTYTDTGADVPTPVSNYKIARLVEGDGDEVFVTFGGRPSAGGTVNTVQGYYPATNTVVTFSADPYPVSTAPGGVAVVGNIAYAFGGFDAVIVLDDTYIFNIMAPDGSRWSTGPNLNMARSYINEAVVDGVIYAIGGADWDGTSLFADTIVEKLDTSNPIAWDDAGVADLPIACDEAQAFGFDTGTNYDLAGAIVVAGCGQWPAELAESQLYDVATDTWDATFPDLNEARRNHAGVFVPTGDKDDNGTPGMWVLGGRQGDDTTVLNQPEFYSVTPLSDLTLLPRSQTVQGSGSIDITIGVSNLTGSDDTFDLDYSGTAGWAITGPDSVAVPDGDTAAVTFQVDIPTTGECLFNDITITGTSQANPATTDSVMARATLLGDTCVASIQGTVTDLNTSLPVEDAYVYLEVITNTTIFREAFTGPDGTYVVALNESELYDYHMYVSAEGYQSTLDLGWIDLPQPSVGATIVQDVELAAPVLELIPDTGFDVTLAPGETATHTLHIHNNGTSDLDFAIGTSAPGVDPTPNTGLPEGLPRIDPRILDDMESAADGQARFIVVMQEQADLSAAYTISDWSERGHTVYDTLVGTANRSQAVVRSLLATEGVNYRVIYSINGLAVTGGRALLDTLAAREEIAYLIANAEVELQTPPPLPLELLHNQNFTPDTVEWGVARVNADDVWSTYGVTGEGIVVANIDTGVEWNHEALLDHYRGGIGDHDYNWYHPTSPEGCDGSAEPCDNNGHGTHTMGTMVGEDASLIHQIGVAPGAQWMACKGCEAGSCSFEALLACGDWMVAPTDLTGANPDPDRRPHIVNNSWGGGGGDFWYEGVVAAWRASGIFPQFSGGNNGPTCNVSGSPGDYGLSFSAGATDITDAIAEFSSRGPAVSSDILKPNISAPGDDVESSYLGNSYVELGGTSMASPHSAGVVALLWSANPELIGQIEDTMWLLEQTADPQFTTDTCGGDDPTSHPNHTYGWGIVDALAAVDLAQSMDVVLDWVTVTPTGGTVAAGNVMEIAVVFTAPDTPGTYTGTLQITANVPGTYDPGPDTRLPLTLTSGEVTYEIYLPYVAWLED